ncbi:hypothetical protein [Planctopirus limnophila]|nr:hypothetical protein [Planctopirus limnophila]
MAKIPTTIDGFYDWLCRQVPEGTTVNFIVALFHSAERGRVYTSVKYNVDLNDYSKDRPEQIRELLNKDFHSLEQAGKWVTNHAIPLLKGARLEVPRPKQRRLTDTPIGLPNKQPLRLEHKPEPSPLIP